MTKLVAITTYRPFPNTEFVLGRKKGLRRAQKEIDSGEPVGIEIYDLVDARGYNGVKVKI